MTRSSPSRTAGDRAPLHRPHIVGYQASGIVRDIGEGVDDFRLGRRVTAMMMNGSHAELASITARKAWPVPDSISFEDAAAIPVEFGTAHDCLFEFGKLEAGESVLVQAGSGGVGLAAIQLAKAAGATVFATAAADEVVIDRSPNRNLAFGAGPHRCQGAHLARLQMRVALEEWHRRIPDYHLADDTILEHGGQFGLESLPIAW